MQLNCSVNQIMNAGGIFYINCLFMPIPTRFSLFFAKISRASRVGDHLVGGIVFACMRACTRVHCLLLSTGSAYPLSKTRMHAGWISRFRHRDDRHCSLSTHLHLLSKRLRTNGDYIIHVSLLRPANVSSSLLRSSHRRQRIFGAGAFDETRTLNHHK